MSIFKSMTCRSHKYSKEKTGKTCNTDFIIICQNLIGIPNFKANFLLFGSFTWLDFFIQKLLEFVRSCSDDQYLSKSHFNFGGKFEFRLQLSLITDGPKFNSKQVLFNIGILNLSLQIRLFVIFVKSNATAKKNLMSIQLLNTKVKKIILAQFVKPISMQSISYQTIYKRIIIKKPKSIYVKFVMSDLLIQKD